MDNATFDFALNTVFDVVITCLGYFFQIFGVATAALFALVVLGAVVRLIINPILGSTIQGGVNAAREYDVGRHITQAREHKRVKKLQARMRKNKQNS